jgi:hypothetical protein
VKNGDILSKINYPYCEMRQNVSVRRSSEVRICVPNTYLTGGEKETVNK